MAAVRRLHAPALGDEAAHAMAAHQALDAPAANPPPVCPQGGVHTGAAISAAAVGMRLADVGEQGAVLDGALAVQTRPPGVVAGYRHPEHAAHGRDGPAATVTVDVPEPHRDGTAKIAIPLFKMSR